MDMTAGECIDTAEVTVTLVKRLEQIAWQPERMTKKPPPPNTIRLLWNIEQMTVTQHNDELTTNLCTV